MDLQKFMSAQVKAREADVSVPALSSFFEKGKKPVWRVRGLTAAELGRAREVHDRSENMRSMIRAMSGDGDKAEEIRKTLGLSPDEVPKDVSQRIEMLAAGSVDPVIGDEHRDVIVRLAEHYPVQFYELTNKIHELTGAGAELGKPKSSGKTRKSG
jgi:hypothetical protein